MPPPTSKAEQFRARADACVKQAENCSTELEKTHWMTLAEDWLKMAQDELPLRSHRRHSSLNQASRNQQRGNASEGGNCPTRSNAIEVTVRSPPAENETANPQEINR